jgi:hypothetical protein
MAPYARAAAASDDTWQLLALDCITSAKWLGDLCGKYIGEGDKKFPVVVHVNGKGEAVDMISHSAELADGALKLVYPEATGNHGEL